MDDDSSCPCRRRNRRTRACLAILGVCLALVIAECLFSEPSIAATDVPEVLPWTDYLPVPVLAAAVVLLAFSAFFSSSETAFLAIHKPRLRTMRTSPHYTLRLVTKMMDRPGRFLTTILVGNMIVNILIGVLLGARVMNLLENRFELSPALAYATAVLLCTAILVFFGEITPKVFAVRAREAYARLAVLPLVAADHALSPIRNGLLAVTDAIFRVSRFHELRAAPFITDDELKSLFDNGEPSAVIEEEERQMIRRILEFHDVTVREILIPRPDVVAIGDDASAREALELFREEGFSRIPVYDGDLDHITGLLFAKDLLPTCSEGKLDQPIIQFVRPPHFVPETTSVQQFVRNAQRLRTHLAVVVDEFGGHRGHRHTPGRPRGSGRRHKGRRQRGGAPLRACRGRRVLRRGKPPLG